MKFPDTKNTILDITSEKPWLLLLFALLAAILGTGVWSVWQLATHDGKPDYCYVEENFGTVRIRSHRPWSENKVICTISIEKGRDKAMDEALAAAKKIGCEVR